jgi:hypothetical protein
MGLGERARAGMVLLAHRIEQLDLEFAVASSSPRRKARGAPRSSAARTISHVLREPRVCAREPFRDFERCRSPIPHTRRSALLSTRIDRRIFSSQ